MNIPIRNFPNYTISEEGVVINTKKNKILKNTLTYQGYLEVQLWKEGKGKSILVHRLVAEHFIENKTPLVNNCVHHKDNNRQNCNYSNLEWVTNKQNTDYKNNSISKGRSSKERIIKLYKSRKWNSVEEFLIEIIKI